MDRTCEVCGNLPRPVSRTLPVVEVELDKRTVTLCRGHAKIAVNSGVTDFEQLRALYGSGRRSYVPRRAPTAPAGGSAKPSGKAKPFGQTKPRSVGRRESDRA